MAIDIIARGLAASLTGEDGKLAPDKRPVFPAMSADGFTPIGNLTDPSQMTGKTAEEVLIMILYGISNPMFTAPSFSAELISSEPIYIDTLNTIRIKLKFDRGAIVPAYGTSGYRAGPRINFYIDNKEVIDANADEYECLINFTPQAKETILNCKVTHEAGEQPLDSAGLQFDAPYPAGELTNDIVINAIYQLFLSDLTLADFTYFKENDGEGYLLNATSEGAGTKQSFVISSDLQVIGIKQFEPMSQQWMWLGGTAETSLVMFDIVPSEKDNFISYTHNGLTVGERQLRIYIS